jgi:hypothetical protein
MTHSMKLFLTLTIAWALLGTRPAYARPHPFHQLVQSKANLEKQFGIQTLECFPFIKKIGFTEDQPTLIANCLKGIQTLTTALGQVPDNQNKVIGIGDRFLRSGGFHTVLIPWNASAEDMARHLKQDLSKKEQNDFLEKVFSLKRKIGERLRISALYCSKEISNVDCASGYENLLKASSPPPQTMVWREIRMADSSLPVKDPYILSLRFSDSPEKMQQALLRNTEKEWIQRRKMYEVMETKYLKEIEKRLQLPTVFCAPDLSMEECEQGAANLHEASANETLQQQFWGQVAIDRYNTLIEDDFNATIRFDLSPGEIVTHFARKPNRQAATQKTVLAEKLEGRTKNNPTRLRAVCDLTGLSSSLCAQAFKTFIAFVKKNRDYRVSTPWDTVMFVNGDALSRVNFALNSKSRTTYIYIHAGSSVKELGGFLKRYQSAGDMD